MKRKFRKFYFKYCSPNYNPDSELDYLSFRNEQNEDMAYLKTIIAQDGCINNQETYKAHYREASDRYFMDLGEVASCTTHEDEYLTRPLRKGYRH